MEQCGGLCPQDLIVYIKTQAFQATMIARTTGK
jgi:hypothetical protein